MIDLYAHVSPNVVKIFIALEEMGLPYRAHLVDLLANEQFAPEFVRISPTAKVPAIVDHDAGLGRPYSVFESGAILIYLAEKTGKFLPRELPARFDTIQWLMMQMANVGPMFGQCVHFTHYAPKDGTSYSLDRYRTQVHRALETVEARLGQVPYLGGADYSIADMATVPWAQYIDPLFGKGARDRYPKIKDWMDGIYARPAVIRAVAAVAAVGAPMTTLDQVSPETFDRFMGRGAYSKA